MAAIENEHLRGLLVEFTEELATGPEVPFSSHDQWWRQVECKFVLR
jgi:hypothetical protein